MFKRWIRPMLRTTGSPKPTRPSARKEPAPVVVDPARVRRTILERAEVDLVIDAGANRGQYGTRLREGGYVGRVISFEPQSAPFERLSERAADDPRWETIRSALGASETTLEMHVAGNEGESSSLLPMLPSHSDRAPGARIVGRERVPVTTVSRCLAERAASATAIYLKLDCQGYEMEVLRGCSDEDLARTVAIEVELSSVPFYEGQPLIDEVVAWLYARGFRMTSLSPVWSDKQTSFCLQADGIFVRERWFESNRVESR